MDATIFLRRCRQCHRDLPLDADHFHRHARHKHGFREVCKECRQRRRKAGRREAYGRAEKTLLLQLAQQIRAGRGRPEHSQLLACLSRYFGGVEGIAQAYAAQYEAAAAGSRTKLAVLNTVYALTMANDRQREEENVQREERLNQMSRDDLKQHFWELTQQMLDQLGYDLVPRNEVG